MDKKDGGYYRYCCSDCGQVANITGRDEFEMDICDGCYEDRMDELDAKEQESVEDR